MREFRDICDLTQREFAKCLGMSGNSIEARLEKGTLNSIRIDVLAKIVEFAIRNGVSIEKLFTGRSGVEIASHDDIINELEARYLTQIRQKPVLSENKGDTRMNVVDLIRGGGAVVFLEALKTLSAYKSTPVLAQEKRKPGFRTIPAEILPLRDWKKKYVPILGRVAAGVGFDDLEATSYPPGWCGEYLEFPDAKPGTIAVRVIGDSMMPDFRDGDMLIININNIADSGEPCCILLDNLGEREALVKILGKKQENMILGSRNPEYPARIVPRKSIVAAYKIMKHLPRSIPDEE